MDSLTIDHVSKRYKGGVQALSDVSLEIKTGMFGLLGPNGSGKTTLMRTIATLQEPDSGSVRLGELDVLADRQAIRRLLGYLPQEFGVYPQLTAYGFLSHIAMLKGVTAPRERRALVDHLLQRTNLWDVRKKKLGGFSGGMKQRFGVAQALIGQPQLIIVDEPTAGLDPEERTRFLNLLSEIGQERVVILSTHIVEDVSDLCTQMAIISEGRVLRTGNPQQQIERLEGCIWQKAVPREQLDRHRAEHTVISTRLLGGMTTIHVHSPERPDDSFRPAVADLKDVYFSTLALAGNGR